LSTINPYQHTFAGKHYWSILTVEPCYSYCHNYKYLSMFVHFSWNCAFNVYLVLTNRPRRANYP